MKALPPAWEIGDVLFNPNCQSVVRIHGFIYRTGVYQGDYLILNPGWGSVKEHEHYFIRIGNYSTNEWEIYKQTKRKFDDVNEERRYPVIDKW